MWNFTRVIISVFIIGTSFNLYAMSCKESKVLSTKYYWPKSRKVFGPEAKLITFNNKLFRPPEIYRAKTIKDVTYIFGERIKDLSLIKPSQTPFGAVTKQPIDPQVLKVWKKILKKIENDPFESRFPYDYLAGQRLHGVPLPLTVKVGPDGRLFGQFRWDDARLVNEGLNKSTQKYFKMIRRTPEFRRAYEETINQWMNVTIQYSPKLKAAYLSRGGYNEIVVEMISYEADGRKSKIPPGLFRLMKKEGYKLRRYALKETVDVNFHADATSLKLDVFGVLPIFLSESLRGGDLALRLENAGWDEGYSDLSARLIIPEGHFKISAQGPFANQQLHQPMIIGEGRRTMLNMFMYKKYDDTGESNHSRRYDYWNTEDLFDDARRAFPPSLIKKIGRPK